MDQTIVITGTDTGAGKTLLTALLLQHLRARGVRALAIKPFCSGSHADVSLLQALQNQELTHKEANPWFFRQPVAPRAVLRAQHADISIDKVIAHINAIGARSEVLLVEGAGGLLAPLGKGYNLADVARRLQCPVLVAGRNRLGCINHALLTCMALSYNKIRKCVIVLHGVRRADPSCGTNRALIEENTDGREVFELPYLGPGASKHRRIAGLEKRCADVLAALLDVVLGVAKEKKRNNSAIFRGPETAKKKKK
jgi:dethiobiotin synthetase